MLKNVNTMSLLVLKSQRISEETSQYKPGGFLRSPRHFLLLLLLLFTLNLCTCNPSLLFIVTSMFVCRGE